MTEGNTGINALIGGVVAVFTAPMFPVSPVAGGAVAGYLEGGELADGALVGAIAGAIAVLPIVLGIGFFGSMTVFAPTIGFPEGVAVLGLFVLLFGLAFIGVYTIGFAALGGVIGSYAKTDTDLGA